MSPLVLKDLKVGIFWTGTLDWRKAKQCESTNELTFYR